MTKIEYLDETINPLQDTRKGDSGRGYHCTKCSPGCQHCWAETINMRFGNKQPFDDTPVYFNIVGHELAKLRKWKKHRYIGVQFMGDLYHPDVKEWMNSYIYGELYTNPQHTYFLLTKREKLMQSFFLGRNIPPHIHGGLTICNQEEADEKLPIFLQIPFATHILSIEPMLEWVDIEPYLRCDGCGYTVKDKGFHMDHRLCTNPTPTIDWVIAGCESGPKRRPAYAQWFRELKNQCVNAGVPFFLKQAGGYINGKSTVVKLPMLDGRQWTERP